MAVKIGIILLVIFFLFIFMNIPISVALGLSTLVTMFIFDLSIDMYASIVFAGISKITLLAIPFFIFAGYVMDRSGISKRLVRFATLLVGPIPGGLAIVSIIVVMFWGALSGSGPATVAALGCILIPAMADAGYDKGFAAALVAASSATAVIIPPSINLVVYGAIAGESIGTLFVSGIVPGIFMGICFGVYALIYSLKNGIKGDRFGTAKEIWAAFKDAFWGLLTPVIILGGIYGGIFTPTEAAVVSVVYSLFIGTFVYKEFDLRTIFDIAADAGVSSATIMIIIANASALTYLITAEGIASTVSSALINGVGNRILIILIMLICLLIAGFFIDAISIEYIFIPLFLPVVNALNLSPIWFGVVISMAVAIGFSTPPVAVNLYPACRIANISLATISKAIVGFLIAGVISLLLVSYIPEIVLWLPRVLGMIA